MAERTTHSQRDEDEPMQTETVYLSSDEETSSQCSMSDQYLTDDADAQYETMKQLAVYRNETSDTAEITISNHDIDLTEASLSKTTNSRSQPTKNIRNVSVATTSYHTQTGPKPIETRRQIKSRANALELPPPSNRGHKNLFRHITCQFFLLKLTFFH